MTPRPRSPRSPSPDPASPTSRPEDVVLLGPELPTGDGRFVLRQRDGRIETGAIRKSEEGKPIHGELVRLSPRDAGEAGLYDVEVLYDGRPKTDTASGPPKVTSDAYREGWGRLFGKKSKSTAN